MKRFFVTLIALGISCSAGFLFTARAMAQTAPADPLKRTAIIGDSMTTGYGASSPTNSYAAKLDRTFNEQGRDVMTFAVNGATAKRWLYCPTNPTRQGCGSEYSKQYEKLKAFNPTAILITLGGNELIISRPANVYASDAVALAKKLYSMVNPGTATAFVRYYDITKFGFVPPTPGTTCDFMDSLGDCKTTWQRQTWAQYGSALNAVAAPNGIGMIDISGDGQSPEQQFVRAHVISDLVHLNDSGHTFYYTKVNGILQQIAPAPSIGSRTNGK